MTDIDSYLDEIFDRLAGTGGAGRRMLAEVEDHLRAAAADGVARGLSAELAEHEAVTRFGEPARIASPLSRAGGWSVMSAVSAAWLLAGLVLVAIGSAYLVNAVAVLLRLHPQQGCPNPPAGAVGGCVPSASYLQESSVIGVAGILTATVLLVVRRLAIRFAGMARAGRRFPLLAAALFAIVGLAAFGFVRNVAPPFDLLMGGAPGLHLPVIATGVAAPAAAMLAISGVIRARRPICLE